jgi:CheY-like chemotaxis protein
MQKTMTPPAKTLPSLLAKASQVELDRSAQHPPEVAVENLRRRGIDILKISWGPELAPKRSFLQMLGFGGSNSAAQPGKVAFIDKQMRVYEPTPRGKVQKELAIDFADVKTVELVAGSGKAARVVRVGFNDRFVSLGAGLQEDSLKWLRDRILLETAGLVWKPLFNVGKRTTRETINPDDEQYRRWQAGPNRLVSLFLEHAPGHMQSLQSAMATRDFSIVRQNAHWLKSSSAAVGAALLSELFQRLEIDIDIKSTTEVDALVTHISSEFQKVSDALSRVSGAGSDDQSAAQSKTLERPAPAADGALAGIKVLLVEDSLVNQEVALDCLHETGCNVTLANDGHEAVARFSEQKFDVILMDCQMSGMDGFRATKIIRDMEFKNGQVKTPIIALTAHALKGDRDICISAGMSDYMSKPFVEEVLIAKIAEWLQAGKTDSAVPAGPEQPANEELATSDLPVAEAAVPAAEFQSQTAA